MQNSRDESEVGKLIEQILRQIGEIIKQILYKFLSELFKGFYFDKNNIISDEQLLDFSTMNAQQIQDFLVLHESALANYSENGKTAAQLIYEACQKHKINPMVVLVTLQKEQGLIIRSNRLSEEELKKRLNFAMGWGKPSNFRDQIWYGTRQFRLCYENLGRYKDVKNKPWSVGEEHFVYDGSIIPANKATACLYVYTPWIGEGGGGRKGVGGNYLFWYLWYRSFNFP
jgi:hypothetical protein